MPGFELFGDKERESVQKALETGVLMRYGFDAMRGGRWMASDLESALAKRMNTEYAHLVSSGTAALTVALASAGVGAGDEVIVPTFTFVASFEAVLALGAIPVLCDIDDTLTLDPEAVRRAITARTKVIMPVHMCGSMADLGALKTIADEYGLLLLEDACQAIGGTYNGQPLGTIGEVGCFSFDYVKTITCGEGGALVTRSRDLYEKAQAFSDHGHDHIGSDRGAEGHPHLGFNFRISELNAAVGLAQLARLDEFLDKQKAHYARLRQAISGLPGVEFRRVPEGGVENYSFLNFFLSDETTARRARQALLAAGVDGVFYWYDNNWHYHRRWDHFKELRSLYRFPELIRERLVSINGRDFAASDHWMGRNLSLLVKLGWDGQELEARAQAMARALSSL
ncbi:DegT/DnrJ/EryC1/StrS family aminotransferase [Robiginitalea marina]|uniref:DegT/DnrJ/EryC1/StrS family aminotransferase n=1 Tax=Robiginitalea marina TaxID=2954105 RepID=A0ABT1ATY8_9FLAO|nr:DegT/DnrJ/EryC1/StrS family aminotransferase [Robiginitalea marina]MCO5723411.1 DegT/DnrJ/EryC1/StrS family aminotransferase [Robiginitalea marina]